MIVGWGCDQWPSDPFQREGRTIAVTWDETDPANGAVAFPDGAGDIRTVKEQVREILNSVFSDNTYPAPPATIANYQSQIPTPGPALTPAPSRIRGDRVDLRGYTWRATAASSAAALPGAPITSNVFTNFGLQIVHTPVSDKSLLILLFQGVVRIGGTTGATNGFAANEAHRCKMRFNYGGGPIGQEFHFLPVVTGGVTSLYAVSMEAAITGLSGATTIDLQGAVHTATFGSIQLYGTLQTSEMRLFEMV